MRRNPARTVAFVLLVPGVALLVAVSLAAISALEQTATWYAAVALLGAALAVAGLVLLLATRRVPESGHLSIPVVVDSVKQLPRFRMTRCTYFAVESRDPDRDWRAELDRRRIPYIPRGHEAVICGPTGGKARFDSAEAIESFYEAIEVEAGLFVDINDVWIPNSAFADRTPKRGDVFRIAPDLLALAERVGDRRSGPVEYEAPGGGVEFSPGETEALAAWNKLQIGETSDWYHAFPEKQLKKRMSKKG